MSVFTILNIFLLLNTFNRQNHMDDNDAYPVIKPHKMKEYEFKQSKFEVAPKVPFSQIVVGSSGSGKTILLQNMVLDIYRDCFSRIYIFSSSIHVDGSGHPSRNT